MNSAYHSQCQPFQSNGSWRLVRQCLHRCNFESQKKCLEMPTTSLYRQQPLYQGESDIIASSMPGILMMKILNLKHKPVNNACAERFQAAPRQVLLHHAGFSFGDQLLCLSLSSIMAKASRSFRHDCNSST